ncbi:MAG: hypothetical protein ACRDMZ_11725 [Solirubrobacteraceae bacterium]
MKHLRAVVALLFPLAGLLAVGCEKPNDLPRLQDEAVATGRIFQHRLDELSHRAAAIGPRVSALPSDLPDAAQARRLHQQALSTIEDRRRDLQQLPLGVQAGIQAGSPGELMRLIDRTRDAQERSATEVTAELSAVESWVALAEQRQGAPGPGAAPPAPDPHDRPHGTRAPAPGGGESSSRRPP